MKIDDLLTERQVADLAGVSQQLINKHRRAGLLKGHQIGGRWLYLRRDAMAYARRKRKRGRPPIRALRAR